MGRGGSGHGDGQGHGHGGEGCSCHEHSVASSLDQDLDELAFERSIIGAASRNDRTAVERMLRNGTDPSQRSATGYTALHYFARHGNVEACEMLISSGADVNAETTTGKATPLHRAARAGRAATVSLLLQHGGDLAKQDLDGQTPMHKAALATTRECYDTLVAELEQRHRHSELDVRDTKGHTAANLLRASSHKPP